MKTINEAYQAALELKRAMDKSTIEDLESRLEEATRLLERCFYWVRDNHAMPSYSELLSDLEAFNKGGQDVP